MSGNKFGRLSEETPFITLKKRSTSVEAPMVESILADSESQSKIEAGPFLLRKHSSNQR